MYCTKRHDRDVSLPNETNNLLLERASLSPSVQAKKHKHSTGYVAINHTATSRIKTSGTARRKAKKECFSILQSCENRAACQPHRVCRTAHRKAKAGQEKWIKKFEHAFFIKSLSRLAWNDSLGKDKSTCFSTRKCDHQDCKTAQTWKTKELGSNEVVRKLSKDKNKMLHQRTPADAELFMGAL